MSEIYPESPPVTAATPGPQPRDRHDGQVTPGQAERDYAEFSAWWQAKGYPDGMSLDFSDARDAFASGMRAARVVAQQPQPAQVDPVPTASWQHAIRALAGIRDSYDTGTMAHDTAHTALDRLAGLYPHGEQPAPELAAAMAETRDVRDGYAKLCDEFSDSPQSGQSARISLTVLNRHRNAAGLNPRRPAPAGERRDPYMQATEDRDALRALLDCETRLRWDTGLERDRITAVREQAGLEALT